jgi:hypothetical protein
MVATIVLSILIAVAMTLVIRSQIKKSKTGKSGCGCGCSGCEVSSSCTPSDLTEQASISSQK